MSATRKLLRERVRDPRNPNVVPVFGPCDQRLLALGIDVKAALVYAPRNLHDKYPWLEPFSSLRYSGRDVCLDTETLHRPDLVWLADTHEKIEQARQEAKANGFDPGPWPWTYGRKQGK